MVALTIVFAILVFLSLDFAVQRVELRRERQRVVVARRNPVGPGTTRAAPLTEVPGGILLSSDHAWVRPAPGSAWQVGADALLCALLGTPESVELPPPGTWVRRGDPLADLRRGGRWLQLVSPVTGRVEVSNVALNEHPEALRLDPYGAGWLCRVEPENPEGGAWAEQHGGAAARAFMAREVKRLRDALAGLDRHPSVGAALTDGGIPSLELPDELDDEAWRSLVGRFLDRREGGRS